MQAIDILRDGTCESIQLFEARQCLVSLVGRGTTKSLPANKRTRPVSLPGLVLFDKVAILDRFLVLPVATVITVVRNAGRSADPGTGKHEDALVVSDEIG
jgi:hypothetical protein